MEYSLVKETYVAKILKTFKILDCKAIATPMASNLKLLCDPTSKIVDAMVYRNMISSFMYPLLSGDHLYVFGFYLWC